MKRILFGLGCTFAIAPVAVFAQDSAPAARLGTPAIVRAQSPTSIDAPKIMPKGKTGNATVNSNPLPMPTSAAPLPGGPALTIPPGATVTGPVIVDPPGAPFAPGSMVGDPFGAGCPTGQPCPTDTSGWYTSAEALLWWVKSYSVPALVTTGPANSGATLSNPATVILYGADSVDSNPRYGARFTLGYWLSPCWAVELSAFYVRPTEDRFTAQSGQYVTQDLARPFFSINRDIESSQIIGRPGVASGFIQVDSESQLYGVELNARRRWWNTCNNRLDLLAGVRYIYLEERLIIQEQTLGLPGAGALAGVERQLTESFSTKNRFLGGQIGAIFEHTEGPWTFGAYAKVAVGISRQTSEIQGIITPVTGGAPPDQPGGLLALDSNIGIRSKDRFAVVPEVGINIGYDITPRLRVFGGYSFIYWTNVARPGMQIDRTLDENRIPDFPAAPATTAVRPASGVTSESIWIQGVNVGVLFKW